MPDSDHNPWDQVLAYVRPQVDAEDYRRWFEPSRYASDSGDQISVWIPTTAVRQHLTQRFIDLIDTAMEEIGRGGTRVRFIVTGTDEDEDDED